MQTILTRGGESFLLLSFFSVINLFHRGPYGPSSRHSWTQRVQLLLEGCPYQNFKGNTQPLVSFQRMGVGTRCPTHPSLDPPMTPQTIFFYCPEWSGRTHYDCARDPVGYAMSGVYLRHILIFCAEGSFLRLNCRLLTVFKINPFKK